MSVSTSLSAVIFDVDGTLADTERDGHRPAFNDAFALHGIEIVWNVAEYGPLLKITGGRRRIATDLRQRGYSDVERLATEIHDTKTALFRERILAGEVKPRSGLRSFTTGLVDAGLRIAVATTGRRAWVEPLVRQVLGDGVVETMVTGDDVDRLKPDPEVYLKTLNQLGLAPEQALAVEDSSVGLRAAASAGIATAVITNEYTEGQDFTDAALVRSAFDGCEPITAVMCRRIHQTWWAR
ncbi:HAD-IA family hydrolase [Mycolicibacterium sp. YH-1]|uniref:HAD-IA family hydrolase n=1 Tax=Mycolicibacterium sp. YH-1 TaxID=2908837 RepID=UPI001F4C4991|nr:HAD-IA family hydrolase [Mycolicibacterium sp. YH-1]UNB49889.1 HAD-IA family hydrolase [Mycolicibacterium sp. YH-1]